MDFEIQCPNCGCVEWKAVEQFTSLTPCRITNGADGVETIYDIRAEMTREAATSVTTLYICGDECGFTVEPLGIHKLGGAT